MNIFNRIFRKKEVEDNGNIAKGKELLEMKDVEADTNIVQDREIFGLGNERISITTRKKSLWLGKPYHEFLKAAIPIAGEAIQQYIDSHGLKLPQFSWIQTSFNYPSFQHLCFRYGSEVFSIIVGEYVNSSAIICEEDYNNQINESKTNNLVPCVVLVDFASHIAIGESCHLYHAESGQKIELKEPIIKECVPMSQWEINNFGINYLMTYIEKNGGKVFSYCDVLGIAPQIWFEKDEKKSYVFVRSCVAGRSNEEYEINQNLLLKLLDFEGYFADLKFSSSSPILKDENGLGVPLSERFGKKDIYAWRGDSFYLHFTGLQPIERAISENEFIKVIVKENYTI